MANDNRPWKAWVVDFRKLDTDITVSFKGFYAPDMQTAVNESQAQLAKPGDWECIGVDSEDRSRYV